MKKNILTSFVILITIFSFGQNNVGIGTATPNASAALDISSTTKGLLIPRMTSVQRTMITTPASGLLVFDTNTKTIWAYDGAIWKNLYSNGGGGTFGLPYAGTDASNTSLQITNTLAGGKAIAGIGNGNNTSSVGVYGEASTGIAVFGETISGIGVTGFSNTVNSIAVKGESLAGIGVKAISSTGIALDVSGKVKISGGKTNPSSGAVLTSDASGNAVWKSNKVGFTAARQINQSIPYNSFLDLTFDEISDAGDDFNTNGSASSPNVFFAPVTGLYHFSASAELSITSSIHNIDFAYIGIGIIGLNTNFAADIAAPYDNTNSYSNAFVKVSGEVRLIAGQGVSVSAWTNNGGSLPTQVGNRRFSGFLVFAD